MSNKIKVAHILHAVGGVDVALRQIIENYSVDHFDHIVIHGKEDTNRDYINANGTRIREYQLPIQREISFFKDIISIIKTVQILRKERPQLIHAHSAKGGIIARTASLFYRVVVFHTPQAYSYLSEKKGSLKRKIYKSIERVFRHFNSVLVASSKSELVRGTHEIGYKKKNAKLFNNSIQPISIEKLPKITSIQPPQSYICTVGRPSFQKNIEMMIEVVREIKGKMPNVQLIIMGVGEYSPNTENIEHLIKTYNLHSHVKLVKWMPRDEVFSVIAQSQLYISTARYEGLPYSIIESLALGKACVVTDCDGNKDLIQNNINGYVIENNDVKTMSNRIFELLMDLEKRKSFEKASSLMFEKNFNIKKNIEKLEALYTKYSKKTSI